MDIPILIPRKYYTIERAARMLRVEVEDIEHWISEAYVLPLVKYNSSNRDIGHITLNQEILELLDSPLSINSFFRGGYLSYVHINGWAAGFRNETAKDFDIRTWKQEVKANQYQVTLSCKIFGHVELSDVTSDTDYFELIVLNQEMNNPVGLIRSCSREDINVVLCLNMEDKTFTRDDVLLSYESVKTLYNLVYPKSQENRDIEPHTELSELLSEKLPLTEHISKNTKIHGNAENNAKTREEVLKFAIYVREEFPELCKTATDWAKAIDEKALLRWKDGEPPLSNSKITDLLREVRRKPVRK